MAVDLLQTSVTGGIVAAAVTFAEILRKVMNARSDETRERAGTALRLSDNREFQRLASDVGRQDIRLDAHSDKIRSLQQWARDHGYDGSA